MKEEPDYLQEPCPTANRSLYFGFLQKKCEPIGPGKGLVSPMNTGVYLHCRHLLLSLETWADPQIPVPFLPKMLRVSRSALLRAWHPVGTQGLWVCCNADTHQQRAVTARRLALSFWNFQSGSSVPSWSRYSSAASS